MAFARRAEGPGLPNDVTAQTALGLALIEEMGLSPRRSRRRRDCEPHSPKIANSRLSQAESP
jgi:hypothetical protein